MKLRYFQNSSNFPSGLELISIHLILTIFYNYGDSKMSIHRSLKVKGNIAGKKNVLKRFERVDQLIKEGRLKAGDPVLGLPKTKVNI